MSSNSFTEISIIVDGVLFVTEVFEDPSVAEACMGGMKLLARHVVQPVSLHRQYHGHSMLWDDCVCPQFNDDDQENWNNDKE